MNEKICKEEIRDALRKEYGMSEQEASDALNNFFSLIVKALEEERYVKIKGLGVFKLIDVESRRGVDVNTGASIEIPSHRKISFSADSRLKELINKPFSHFETVPLKEDALLEEPIQEDGEEKGETACAEGVDNEDSQKEELVAGDGVGKEEKETEVLAMDERSENGEDRLQPLMKREDLHKMELMMEREERKNRIAMAIVAVLMVLVFIGGLVFMFAPEWIERLIYGF